MTHEELVTKVREHMTLFDQQNSYGVALKDFTDAQVAETARIFLRRPQRDDCLEVHVDRDTGDFIMAIYHPGDQNQVSGYFDNRECRTNRWSERG